MLHRFRAHIEKLCKTTDKILLAVSGGMDSMAMLDLFRQTGFSISVAHCNFQLRGEESDEDERFVAATCKTWNVPFQCIRFDTLNYATQKGLSVQMAARELRYNWFNELREKENLHWIATAHHLNDAAETVVLNIAKGTGLDGLLGIAAKNRFVVRPMLFASHADIVNYASETGLMWREDRSNQTDDYQRNFVRHHVIPKLKEINPAFEKTVERMADRISGDLAIINSAIEHWKREFQKTENEKIIFAKIGFENSGDVAYATALLWRLLHGVGFRFDQCKQIALILNRQSGKKFFSISHQLVIDRENIIVAPHANILTEVLIDEDDVEAILGATHLTFNTSTNLDTVADRSIALLDKSRLRFPLTWRKWKAGDSFYPLGMSVRKKLSDFLIDVKVSVIEKEEVTVLESAGEIVWVVGHRIDDRHKVTSATTHVLVINLT